MACCCPFSCKLLTRTERRGGHVWKWCGPEIWVISCHIVHHWKALEPPPSAVEHEQSSPTPPQGQTTSHGRSGSRPIPTTPGPDSFKMPEKENWNRKKNCSYQKIARRAFVLHDHQSSKKYQTSSKITLGNHCRISESPINQTKSSQTSSPSPNFPPPVAAAAQQPGCRRGRQLPRLLGAPAATGSPATSRGARWSAASHGQIKGQVLPMGRSWVKFGNPQKK